ncbi:MAG: NarK/NasA family nitrate transporter, partial [Cyanobacteria bacterium SZAS LIN-5]|nr:NarK/NasA family nitrate transporter [Cyanobacteria bacterium SZAS LIN-5]
MMDTFANSRQKTALTLGSLAFAISFAIWGLLSGLMPILKKDLHLTATEASLLVALPVILGSLGRLPAGIMADRFGGKRIFLAILILMLIPAVALGFAHDYSTYMIVAAFLGIAGTSFSVGVTFVSRWFPPEKQGTALGVYGAGNIGQSIAVFGAPALASHLGISWAAWIFAAAALIYAAIFCRLAEDAQWHVNPKSFSQCMSVLLKQPMSWVLSLLYFQTFGGFVALALYMPMLLKELFDLTPADAGLRTAVFVLIATFGRPLGGWVSDRFNPDRILTVVLTGLIPCAFLMTSPDLGYFTVGALSAAALVGIGNGAVFKLVPSIFPKDVGTVTGLVGAAGGMG